MGHAIPKQHPAVVLRSHYNLVRALLGVSMVALVGLVIALVVVANDDNEPASTSAVQAAPVTPRVAPAQPAIPTPAPQAVSPGTRYDGGPEEGTRGAIQSPAVPGTRYDGGPDEGTRSPLTSQASPGGGPPAESRNGPGYRTD